MKNISIALRLFLWMTVLTGILYPLAVTGAAQWIFPDQANGSLLHRGDQVIGSELISQEFKKNEYFWPRPSAVSYNPLPSGGSNLGPTSKSLLEAMEARKKLWTEAAGLQEPVPEELLFASASGLDPHISPAAARYQLRRVALARHLSLPKTRDLLALINTMTEPRTFGILGEERVNVLKLNLELDKGFQVLDERK